jgi:hypothetical protein
MLHKKAARAKAKPMTNKMNITAKNIARAKPTATPPKIVVAASLAELEDEAAAEDEAMEEETAEELLPAVTAAKLKLTATIAITKPIKAKIMTKTTLAIGFLG